MTQHALNSTFGIFSLFIFLAGMLILSPSVAAAIETTIIADMKVEGEYSKAGDTFWVTATVKNIGSEPAKGVQGSLLNVPDGWIVHPQSLGVEFGTIPPGHEKERQWRITRNEQDATISFGAGGSNVNRAHSGTVNIPIHPFILLAFAGVVLSSVVRRRPTG